MRCSCGFFSLPRQYAAALRISLNAGMCRVVGTCGPRHRSVQTRSPVRASRLSYIVSCAAADLDVGTLGRLVRAALEADQLELVRLVGELGLRRRRR